MGTLEVDGFQQRLQNRGGVKSAPWGNSANTTQIHVITTNLPNCCREINEVLLFRHCKSVHRGNTVVFKPDGLQASEVPNSMHKLPGHGIGWHPKYTMHGSMLNGGQVVTAAGKGKLPNIGQHRYCSLIIPKNGLAGGSLSIDNLLGSDLKLPQRFPE